MSDPLGSRVAAPDSQDSPVPVDPPGPAGPTPPGTKAADQVNDASVAEHPVGEPEQAAEAAPSTDAAEAAPSTEATGEPGSADGPTSGAAPEPQMAQFSIALVSGVSVDLPNQYPAVVLRETESPRRQLTFSIGLPDAIALSHAMRRIPTPRPLTHELLSGILQGFDIDVVAVRLVGRQGSIYFAELDLQGRSGRSVLSCRPSDGLTVALLQPVPAPILIDRRLLELDGDVLPPRPPVAAT